jgi:hypothetical protein
LTEADATPGALPRLRSSLAAQPAQLMPLMGKDH